MKEINNEILNKKYFIFDIDGTLVDSMGMWNIVDQQVIFNNIGQKIDLMDIKMFRDSIIYNNANLHGDIYVKYYEELINYYGLTLSVEELRSQRRELSEFISINELDYKEGAGEFLKILKQMEKKIGVATTSIRSQYAIYQNKNKKMHKKAPLDKLVDQYVICEDVSRKKPDPEAYLLVMKKLNAKPEECIVFEDSINGVISAKEAGLEVVAVYDEFAANEQDLIHKIADYKIESFAELIKTLGLDKSQSQPE